MNPLRYAALVVSALAIGACGSDGGVGIDEVVIAGDYQLHTVDGEALPVTRGNWEYLDGGLMLRSDGSARVGFEIRDQTGLIQLLDLIAEWTADGGDVTFDFPNGEVWTALYDDPAMTVTTNDGSVLYYTRR